jgi:hypothetical protein
MAAPKDSSSHPPVQENTLRYQEDTQHADLLQQFFNSMEIKTKLITF